MFFSGVNDTGPTGILRGQGDTDSGKKLEAENLESDFL
jgi:hypothetical protein